MRLVGAFLLCVAFLAGPAAAGKRELIRFRGPDGTPGLVDDADKLPPGAVVIERTPLAEIAAEREREAAVEDEAPDAESELDAPTSARPDLERGERCLQYGLSPGCSSEQASQASHWCARAEDVHRAREEAELNHAAAEEAWDDCRTAGGTVPYCSRRRLDAAEHAVEEAERGLEHLQGECREADCLPGWIREGCER
jgi:hypothetical protein